MRLTRQKRKERAERFLFASLFILFAAAGIIAAVNIVFARSNYTKAQTEYDELRKLAPPAISVAYDASGLSAGSTPYGAAAAPGASEASGELAQGEQQGNARVVTPLKSGAEAQTELLGINPDYVGWLRVDGTAIDYPVVKGADNDRYLNTTFTGEGNASGAIFMDYRCSEDFDSAFALVYGHNMRDGSMFAPLLNYPGNSRQTENHTISILSPDGDARVYSVFAVRTTDIHDTAFNLPGKGRESAQRYSSELGAPENTDILVLSTCTDRDDDLIERGIGRVLVFAYAQRRL